MRPNRSVEMPPTKPVGAPRRAMATAVLRHDPPTIGMSASRPSGTLTGKKSINASPQLSNMASISWNGRFRSLHGKAARLVQLTQQSVDASFGAVEVGHSRRRRIGQTTDRRHGLHGLDN